VARTDEFGNRLLIDLAFSKQMRLVLFLDRCAAADLTVTLTNSDRNVGDLPTPCSRRFSGRQASGTPPQEALHVMRLKTLRFGFFHLQPKFLDHSLRHGCHW